MARLFALLGCLFGLVPALFAADTRAEGSTVWVNRVKTVMFQASSPRTRAATLARNLRGVGNVPVTTRTTRRTAKVLVGGRVMILVSREDARAAGTRAGLLAARWASQIRTALSLPPIKLESEHVRMAVGTVRTVRVVGAKAATAQIEIVPASGATAQRTAEGLSVKPLAPGDTTVTLRSGATVATLVVEGRPFAAAFPQRATAVVTGSPADEWTMRGAIEGALKQQLTGQAGVRWTYDLSAIRSLPSGSARTISVPVAATAPDAFPAKGQVQVTVRNSPVGSMREAELWYCNDPENVRTFGPLFNATLRKEAPARLLYHHINAATQPFVLRVQVVNESDEEARVAITPGDAEPSKNPVLAGFVAGDRFVRSWVTGSAEVVTIPARSVLPISVRRLSPEETASGLCTLHLVDGPATLAVRTDAIPAFTPDVRWQAALASPTPWREVGTRPISQIDQWVGSPTRHVYPNPFREETATYEVGGRHRFIRVGQRPITSEDQAGRLDGNFGVVYSVAATVTNPTTTATDVEVIFEASAGYTGGLFFVDGRYVKTPLLQPKGESPIARFRMEPGANRVVRILTVPLSGGSYPITLTVRAVSAIGSR